MESQKQNTGTIKLGRLNLLIRMCFIEAATIKDNPEVSPVVKQIVKQAFNQFWNVSRQMVKVTDKYVAEANVESNVDKSEVLMYEVIQAIFNSPDPAKSLALLQAFNMGEVEITN